MNTETQAPPELLTLGPWGIAAFTAITITVLVLGYLMVRGKNKAVVLILAALGMLALAGCATDPFVRQSIVELRSGAAVIMDEHARMAEKAGEPKLPAEYREDKLQAYDDLLDYLDGKRPEIPEKSP